MRKVTACFFCTTPYQVMAAICIVKSNGIAADLYIQNQFRRAEEFAENIRCENIFEAVQIVDDAFIKERYLAHKTNSGLHLRMALTYLSVDKIAMGMLIPDTEYREMYVSSKAYVSRLVYLYFIKSKRDLELFYYDDGEGSYDNDDTYGIGLLDSIIRLVLFGRKSISKDHVKYLYDLDLYHKLNPRSQYEDIRKIPCIWKKSDMHPMLNRIFSLTDEMDIQEPVIFVDTLRSADQIEMNAMVDSVLDLLCRYLGKINIMIKKHPRDKDNRIPGFLYYEFNSVPFEAISMKMDVEEKLLVVIQSTAAVMPKILLDREPYVIMLYKLIDVPRTDSKSDMFFKACAEEYRKPGRFYIPETYGELEQIVEKVKDQILCKNVDHG